MVKRSDLFKMGDAIMFKLEKLFKIAEDNCIVIEYIKLPKNIYGIYYKGEGLVPAIGINTLISNDDKLLTCVLAEELGHHFTTIGDTTAECYCLTDRILLDKCELKALKWASKTLFSPKELINAFSIYTSTYECADFLGVTESFLLKSIEIFKNSNLFTSDMQKHIFF